MKFLADECFDARLAAALSQEGHDVLSVQEAMTGANDEVVLTRAYNEQRILLTEDTDFGELVYRLKQPARGVILLRLEAMPIAGKLDRLRSALESVGHVSGHFVVVEPEQTRVRPLP